MLFPFAITLQQNKLNKRIKTLADSKHKYGVEPVKDIRKALQAENDAFQLYCSRTRTLKGKLKSFIPHTTEFKTRLICAIRIEAAHKALNNIEALVISAKQQHQNQIDKKSLRATKSADNNVLPRHHDFIFQNRRNSFSNYSNSQITSRRRFTLVN